MCPASVSVAVVVAMALAVREAGVVKLTVWSAAVAQAESAYALKVYDVFGERLLSACV